MNIKEALRKGHITLANEHTKKDQEREPTYRAGSSGIYNGSDIKGNCHRLTMLRYMGWQPPAELSAHPMFQLGESNEDALQATLEAAGITVRRGGDSEYSLEWEGEHGPLKVTGTPDLIVESSEGSYVLELKNMSSIYTARAVTGDMKPKGNHLIQAALYSLMIGIPAKLVYSNRVIWHILYNKHISASMQGHPAVSHQENKDGTQRPFKIEPHYTVYDLLWINGKIHYRLEESDSEADLVETDITAESIKAYYEGVEDMRKSKILGPRPSSTSVDGSKSYKPCDYCALKDVCNEHDSDYDRWLDASKIEIQRLNKEYGYSS